MARNADYFRDEIRNGFYIPTVVKQSWANALDVLSEIDRICKKHDISYFADWGSFLGAVRHGGIIPWDDDIDIAMLREDYDKFRAVADDELPDGYTIHDYERQEDHWLFIARVVGSKRISFDVDYLNSHYNFPWITGIDIFVKDHLYKDPDEEKKRCDEVMHILAVAEGIISGSWGKTVIEEQSRNLEKKYGIKLPISSSKRDLAIALYRLAEKQMARCPIENSDKIGQIFPWILKGVPGVPAYQYSSFIRIPFEDTTIPVPAYFNTVLSARYRNYNVIHKNWNGHGYPAFDMQRKGFEEDCDTKLPSFSFDDSMTVRPVIDNSSSLKKLAHERLGEFDRTYKESVAALSNGDHQQLEDLLNSMQQLAVDLGTMTENVKGEDSPRTKRIVKCLEDLCETIFVCFNNVTSNDDKDLSPIREQLDKLAITLEDDLFQVKEILFLPVGPVEWSGFECTYRKYINDSRCEVVVIPLPLLTKNCLGQITSNDEEIATASHIDEYPVGLTLSSWADYDLSLHCPETVFIQNTYDGENPYLTVPPYYYASNLRNYTEDLCYIPIGKTLEFTKDDIPDQTCMGFYLTMPGAVYADRIMVQSENIRTQYINKLTGWAGKKTLGYWEKKIIFAEGLYDAAGSKTDSSSSKKELLFCINLYEFIEHTDIFGSAVASRFELMTKNKDTLHLSVCLYPDYLNDKIDIPEQYQKFYSLTMDIVNRLGVDVIPFPRTDLVGFVQKYDAYYGSSSPLVPVFTAEKKPVMIADYEITP